MTSPVDDLAELIGPHAYIAAYADAYDALAPGLGDNLRAIWAEVVAMCRRRNAGLSGAADELEFFGGGR